MYSAFVLSYRVVAGLAVLFFIWFVFDRIHDRNTEIIAAILGLQYSFVFLISRRLEYFGLSIFSFFGRSVSYIQRMPYDEILRNEVGMQTTGRHLYLNILFAALTELLCVFRLLTSLVGQGWHALSDQVNVVINPFLANLH